METLAKANDFTLEDLQANRQGWMSPRQRAGAIRRTIGWFFLLLILAGGIVGALLPLVGDFLRCCSPGVTGSLREERKQAWRTERKLLSACSQPNALQSNQREVFSHG